MNEQGMQAKNNMSLVACWEWKKVWKISFIMHIWKLTWNWIFF